MQRISGYRGTVGTEVLRSKEHEIVTNNCCVNWTDFTGMKLPFNYKIQSLETEDQDALFAVYVSLYPDLQIIRIARGETIKKYASVIIGSPHSSSKLECYSLCSARMYASLATTNEGALNLDTFLLVMLFISFPIQ